ncbi:MAG: right-handed parallel beta-helix repeat-containing protein, partial [Anaerolineae bacterium]|nr:right-handed parallel beta-helix repeat-containing protein [Anaerolineae bacterium]
GPLASMTGARDAVRRLKAAGLLPASLTVKFRGGRYPLSKPVVFTPADSAPVTYTAYPGEQPVFEGGVQLNGWKSTQVNGVDAWVTDAPFDFRQLFVNGKRQPRPRLPKQGEYNIAAVEGDVNKMTLFEGTDHFQTAPGDLQGSWRNLNDVELVVTHFWAEERLPIQSFDAATNTLISTRKLLFNPRQDFADTLAPYYVENVFEALTEPGEWYLDRGDRRVYYIPLPGQTLENTEIYAAHTLQFIRVEGTPDHPVSFIRFQGLAFEHSDWVQPYGYGMRFNPYGPTRTDYTMEDTEINPPGEKQYACAAQAAYNVPGTLYFEYAANCAVENCRVEHVGWYGIELAEGCSAIQLTDNTLADLGAGGIKIGGASVRGPRHDQTGHNRVTGNTIHHGGEIFLSGVGIALLHSFGNTIADNHIHDLYYSAISCGWVWGLKDNISRENRIEHNLIHDLGFGILSDMGGIYMLGIQPGTVLRGNRIFNVKARGYGGWGIYLDEGSAHMLVEGNIVYNTWSESFHQNYGRENLIRNNIFAFSETGGARLSREDSTHNSITFERNIFITDGNPIFTTGRAQLEHRPFLSDLNLFYDVTGAEPVFYTGSSKNGTKFTLEEYRAFGNDRHTVVADPGMEPPDFALSADSPAHEIGFEALDVPSVP